MEHDDWTAPPSAPRAVAESINYFGADLYRRAAPDGGNLFLSPFSVHAALSLAFAGAAWATARQLAEALRWPADPGAGATYGSFIAAIAGGSKRLIVANALWAQEGSALRPEFARRIERDLHAGIRRVDFAGAAEAARSAINAWASQYTLGRIRDVVPPGGVSDETRLVLTNAIHFKARWLHPFDPADTQDAPFRLAGGAAVRVPTMHLSEQLAAAETEHYLTVALPYRDLETHLQLFVPRRAEDMPWVERTILAGGREAWDRDLCWRQVRLWMPRFRFDAALVLGEALQAMGISDAFDPARADFSGMTESQRFWLSEVFHRAYVNVDEEGTEAAAATGSILTTGAGPSYRPLEIRADRPFLFTIRHTTKADVSTLLFAGRVADPRS